MNKPGTAGFTYYSATFIDNGRDDDLVDKIPVGYTFEDKHGGFPYGSFYKDGIEYAIGMDHAGTEPLANLEFPLQFTVAAASPATVDVVNNQQGPITLKTGSNVEVRWTSDYATSCTCQCQNLSGKAINCGTETTSSCGSGLYTGATPVIISGLKEPTTFKVTCN